MVVTTLCSQSLLYWDTSSHSTYNNYYFVLVCQYLRSLPLLGMVDTIFSDVAQPDQARIVSLNALHFLKNQGHFVMSIKVQYSCNERETDVILSLHF